MRFPRQLIWFLLGSCLLTIGSDPQRQHVVRGKSFKESVKSVVSVFGTANTVYQSIDTAWQLFDTLAGIPDKQDKILQQIKQVSDQIASSERRIVSKLEFTMASLIKQLAIESRLDRDLKDLASLMNQISHQERTMRFYLQSKEPVEQLTLEDFARSTVSRGLNGVPGLLSGIDLLVGGSHDLSFTRIGVLELLVHAFQEDQLKICTFGLSAQQVLFNLYNAVVITELKGYAMAHFSWMLLKTYGKGNFTAEVDLMKLDSKDRINRWQSLLRRTMSRVSGEFWRCDPEPNQQHKEGDTYLQITRLLQGYIEHHVGSCPDDCKKDIPCPSYLYRYDAGGCLSIYQCINMKSDCAGKYYDCEITIHKQVSICPASTNSTRRYDYIEFGNGVVLGQKKTCTQKRVEFKRSFWQTIFGTFSCRRFYCLCDEVGQKSDRYINMRQSVSDIGNNKVVTGLRFVKKNRVIYLIVQQGTLLPQGQIDNATLEWVEPKAYDVHSSNVKNGVDFNVLSYHYRTMDLDDIILQPGYVLTGVSFTLQNGTMKLNARMTEMDFSTGKLVNSGKSIWTKSNGTKRSELKLDHPYIPLMSPSKSVPDSISGQFIKFRPSDRDSDAAQTTVPFFDAQPVVPVTKTPLGGCGIFHKGQPKFGGYVAPKVFTYDYAAPVVQKQQASDDDEEEDRLIFH